MSITKKMVCRLSGGEDPLSTSGRQRLGIIEGWVSTVVSCLLAGVKIWFGLFSGSVSLVADAANNATDAATSFIVAISFHWSRKPGDAKHPFGHGRMECIAAIVLSVLLIVVGVEVAKSGLFRLLNPSPLIITSSVMLVVFITIVVKAVLAGFVFVLARATGSDVLRADAWNHSFDILCTGTVLLGLWGAKHGWVALDAWSAILVALFIVYTGFRFAIETVSKLLGEAPSCDEISAIEKIGMSFPFVHDVHDIMIHRYGDLRIVSFHVEMDAGHDAILLHDEAEQIEAAVESAMACKAIIHVDPVDRNHPAYEKVRRCIEDVISTNEMLRAFHDLRVSGPLNELDISVDVVLYIGACDCEFQEWAERISKQIRTIAGEKAHIEVRIEKLYDGRENGQK